MYVEIKDSERNLKAQLKIEQSKVVELEEKLNKAEDRCKMHLDRNATLSSDKNRFVSQVSNFVVDCFYAVKSGKFYVFERLEELNIQNEEDLCVLSNDILNLRSQLEVTIIYHYVYQYLSKPVG